METIPLYMIMLAVGMLQIGPRLYLAVYTPPICLGRQQQRSPRSAEADSLDVCIDRARVQAAQLTFSHRPLSPVLVV